ncbi:MAG TPA: hypothetical protein VMG12_22765 [Polyangiaceae bacterium]|nr:hypothetical protein [Polyangiaceae bacterium]
MELFGDGHDGFFGGGGELGDAEFELIEGEVVGDGRNIQERVPSSLADRG